MSIQVGVFNWDFFASNADFYPADLPAAWKLLYYANEFNSACINLSFAQQDYDQFNELLEDLPVTFELSLALSGPAQLDEWLRLMQPGLEKCRFLVLPATQPLQELMQDLNKNKLARIGITDANQLVTQTALWTPEQPAASSNIAVLPMQKEIKLYREWIEQWIHSQNTECRAQSSSTLWLEGAKADYSTLSRLRSLVELMGY